VVVVDDVIVGQAHNAPIALVDPTAHAEVLALREAAQKVGNYRLPGAVLYATLEPCAMCCGAVIQARLARVVYGAPDPRAGAVESRYWLLDDGRLNHRVEALGGVLGAECGALLKEFFETKRG
jgi:tRNA(adenine34) deaminase